MTDKIKFYLEDRLKRLEDIKNKREWTTAELGDATCCKQTLEFINSLQEEPVSEDLEEAAKNHAVERYRATRDMVLAEKCKWSFKAGAEWQKQKIKCIVDRINVDNHDYEDLEDLYDAICEMTKH